MENFSETDSTSKTTGTSKSDTEGTSTANSYSVGANIGAMVSAFASIGVGIPMVPIMVGVGSAIGANLGLSTGYARTNSKNKSTTLSSNESDTLSRARTTGTSSGTTSTEGKNIDVNFENKTVKNLIDKLETQFERIREFENYGAWQSAGYFFSKDPQVSKIAASYYSSLISGEDTNVEKNYINTWTKIENESNLKKLKEYLFNLYHPMIQIDKEGTIITPAMNITTKELAISHSLPKKSISGVVVSESATFGRDIFSKVKDSTIKIGNLYHLNNIEDRKAELNLNSLSSHTFITGSTGSGKSNAIYGILEDLYCKGIKFMVIEPAKGEYKDIFGGRDEVSVYGSNPKISNILKINPFSFHENIHILEHIDRLIEIFNACWPMYATMPAILKEAIEKAYMSLGWDLDNSKNLYGEIKFPTFETLQKSLDKVIEESSYSEEFKSNYKGALLTRVSSLSNGLVGRIFQEDEISSEDLFDRNVIVDISRIPSMETKSLIMGVLFIKLHEYRMVSSEETNEKLKHVTVLEEAHHLLKRTSTSQSQEGVNLQGKSVEMIANSIAEMRTYGEGFIIADQAPGLLDESVIRNTNTKICLRLPSKDDREIVGKSMNLNDEQISELARLETGVAAIYQNDWHESCLVKFDYMDNKDKHSYERENENVNEKIDVVKYLFNSIFPELNIEKKEQFEKNGKDYLDKNNIKGTEINIKEFDRIVSNLLNVEKILEILESEKNRDINEWNQKLIKILENFYGINEKNLQIEIIHSMIRRLVELESKNMEFYSSWRENIGQRRGVNGIF